MKKLGLFDNLFLHVDRRHVTAFNAQLRIDNLKRVYLLSLIGILFFVLLMGLDLIRFLNGVFETNPLAFPLFINHLALAPFVIPLLLISRKREEILSGRFKYERLVIYSAVVYSGLCLLTMAILSLLDRNSILLYGIFAIVTNFIVIFPHKQRIAFNLTSFLIIVAAIVLIDVFTDRSLVIMYINILECIGATIPAFSISTHLYNDRVNRYTYELLLEGKNREIEQKNEELNVLARQLQVLNARRSQLYTNITHEFRTPLTVILGMVDHMRSTDGNTRSALQEGLSIVERNSKNLLRLINQILDLSKLESGSLEVNYIRADIIAFLRYLNEPFQTLSASRGLQLRFLTELESLEMDFDPDKIQQIYYNLLSNAIKFTPESGQITVTVRTERADEQDTLLLLVKDSGIGIDPEKVAFIFDRFYQAGDAGAGTKTGSGIGLALTKELVELTGGIVSVDSALQKGTTFTVQLPVYRTAAYSASEEVRAAVEPINLPADPPGLKDSEVDETNFVRESGRPQLLVIEDNPDVMHYLKSCLRDDYQLHTAYNGRQGISKALELIPDMIISDVLMPEKDGFEVCAALKEDERTNHIPIILLTAKSGISDKIAGLEHGADIYMSKPFQKKELLLQLKNLLDLRNQLHLKFAKGSQYWEHTLSGDPEARDAFLGRLNETVEANLQDDSFGTPQLCKALGMSRSQIHRKIKAVTNLSTSNYIRTMRLYKAKELLHRTDLNISEVAYAVGFKDPNYFTHVFVDEFGATPSATRK